MKVDRLDIDVGVEGVLVEENHAACIMGHVEPTCKNVMIDIIRSLLQGNDRPFSPQSVFRRRLLFRVWAQGSTKLDIKLLLQLTVKSLFRAALIHKCSRAEEGLSWEGKRLNSPNCAFPS